MEKREVEEKSRSLEDQVEVFVIYDHPSDFPDSFVVRRWVGGVPDTDLFCASHQLDVIRRELLARGLYPIPRNIEDDPVIVETWV
jgi:hypothetical protein